MTKSLTDLLDARDQFNRELKQPLLRLVRKGDSVAENAASEHLVMKMVTERSFGAFLECAHGCCTDALMKARPRKSNPEEKNSGGPYDSIAGMLQVIVAIIDVYERARLDRVLNSTIRLLS